MSAALIAIAIFVGITLFSGGSAHPTVAVTTGSMIPIYNGFQDTGSAPIHPFRGDILLVKKVPIESIEVGDVIVFDTTMVPEPVVHRVVDKWQQNGIFYFKTNGDNRDDPDRWEDIEGSISGEKVFGVVVLRIPHVGWFLLAVQTTLGRIIVLALAVLILFIGGDSEEDKDNEKANNETEKVDSSVVENNHDTSQHEEPLTIITRIMNIGTRIIQRKTYIYAVLALAIICIFCGSNLISALVSPPSIKLYRIEDSSRTNNLIESPSSLSRNYQWTDSFNQTSYFFPIQIEIQSGGIFNNIDRIEIRVNETKGLYRWNTVYNFIGKRIFEGAIIAFMDGTSTSNVSVSLTLYSRGLFASPTQIYNFSIFLHSG